MSYEKKYLPVDSDIKEEWDEREDRVESELSSLDNMLALSVNIKGALPPGDASTAAYWNALQTGIYQTIGADGISGLPGKYGVALLHKSASYISVIFTSTTGTGTGYGAWVYSGGWLKIT